MTRFCPKCGWECRVHDVAFLRERNVSLQRIDHLEGALRQAVTALEAAAPWVAMEAEDTSMPVKAADAQRVLDQIEAALAAGRESNDAN